jgi:hypothetical protein
LGGIPEYLIRDRWFGQEKDFNPSTGNGDSGRGQIEILFLFLVKFGKTVRGFRMTIEFLTSYKHPVGLYSSQGMAM